MATQFRYQTPLRHQGALTGFGETIALIDLNLDGRKEIVLPISNQRTAGDIELPVLFFNYDPAAGLSAATLRDSTGGVLTTSWLQETTIGDFNGDGRADLLISDHGSEAYSPFVGGRLQVWLSSPSGPVVSLVSQGVVPRAFWHNSGAADFNRDGKLDVVAVNISGTFGTLLRSAIFVNNGQGVFTLDNSQFPSTANSTGNNENISGILSAGDLDRDGFADLVWLGGQGIYNMPQKPGEGRVYFGSATGLTNSYSVLPYPDLALQGRSNLQTAGDEVKVADFNGDGLLDVSTILTNNNTGVRWGQIWLQGPNRTFTELKLWPDNLMPTFGKTGLVVDGIVAVDVNNDGLMDIHYELDANSSLSEIAQLTYINMGDGTYQTLAALAPGVLAGVPNETGAQFGLNRWIDLDGDGQVELMGARLYSLAGAQTRDYYTFRLAPEAMQVTAGTAAKGTIFNDVITGTAAADSIDGWLGKDTITAGAGDDAIAGGAGDDRIDGGEGADVAVYSGRKADYSVRNGVAGWTITDDRANSPDGTDTLISVEFLQFSDVRSALAVTPPKITVPAALGTVMTNLLRAEATSAATVDLAANLVARMTAGQTLGQVTAEVVKAADATTSVATLAYQFFTGKIPGQGGIDYLVSPTGPNPNNLNSAYYQSFNIENRYINFAVNLGKNGDGAVSFLAAYGNKSLSETVKGAYATIFGSTPTDAKVAALLAGGRDAYFASYGLDGLTGIGTKAAAVGWLLAEAAKGDIGTYSKANDAFLVDLADGANFAVDLIGVYGKPEFAFTG